MKSRIDTEFSHEKLSFSNMFGGDPTSAASGGHGDVAPALLGLVDRNGRPGSHTVAGLGIFLQVLKQRVILLNCLARDVFT